MDAELLCDARGVLLDGLQPFRDCDGFQIVNLPLKKGASV